MQKTDAHLLKYGKLVLLGVCYYLFYLKSIKMVDIQESNINFNNTEDIMTAFVGHRRIYQIINHEGGTK